MRKITAARAELEQTAQEIQSGKAAGSRRLYTIHAYLPRANNEVISL